MRFADVPAWRIGMLLLGGAVILGLRWIVERRPRSKKRYCDMSAEEKEAYKLASTIDRSTN